ncbi:MAG TPA: hypothetical protein VIL97_11605 [Thermoanaerobaculia bacterium]
MKKLMTLSLSFVLALSLAACGKEKSRAAIKEDLEERGTMDLMKEVADDRYDPPTDGKLTEKQIEMYLKVREHEKEIAKVAMKDLQERAKKSEAKGGDKSISGMMEAFKGMGALADVLTADIRAAKDLGYNTQEYQWVKSKVLEASGAAMMAQATQATSAMMDASYAQMKKQYDEATDEATKKMLGEALAGYETSRQEMAAQQEPVDPAIEYNRQLLSKHENALNALAAELSKFETKEGEAQQNMEKWQKDLDKSVEDAQQQTNTDGQ